jgi:hypothetical protein
MTKKKLKKVFENIKMHQTKIKQLSKCQNQTAKYAEMRASHNKNTLPIG